MLQKGPQDLPASSLLLSVVFLLGLVLDLVNLQIAVPDSSLLTLAIMSLIYVAVLTGSLSLLMWLLRYRQRIIQTLTALLGCGAIISAFAFPLLLIVQRQPEEPSIFGVFILGINIWHLAVSAHILRFALSVSMLMAGVLAFGYFLLGFKITDLFISSAA
ncbi:MAG: hypothetical protein PVG18_01115 [Thioalkalispiraceae bacterium]|jgi:hypothetical protein